MAGHGAPPAARLDGRGLRVGVVASRWHEQIVEGLLGGALRALRDCGVADPTVLRVPGAFELALVAAELAVHCDAVVALGLVLRGGTPHFDYVCSAATTGLTRVALDAGTPVGFGLLTCDTEEQARDRAGLPGSAEDKGGEAALSAVETALVLRSVRRAAVPAGFSAAGAGDAGASGRG